MEKAVAYGDRLFGTPNSAGVRLGIDALRAVAPARTVSAVLTGYWNTLRAMISLS